MSEAAQNPNPPRAEQPRGEAGISEIIDFKARQQDIDTVLEHYDLHQRMSWTGRALMWITWRESPHRAFAQSLLAKLIAGGWTPPGSGDRHE